MDTTIPEPPGVMRDIDFQPGVAYLYAGFTTTQSLP
jgi:hypothetical protein